MISDEDGFGRQCSFAAACGMRLRWTCCIGSGSSGRPAARAHDDREISACVTQRVIFA
jgi:hypothetical protein